MPMNINEAISGLVHYAVQKGLIDPSDRVWAINRLLPALGLDSYEEPESPKEQPLEELLKTLLDYAVANGVIEDGVTQRDLLDTELMGRLTPVPPG